MPVSPDTTPAIGFSVTIQIDDKHAITAQTHVDQESDQGFIDAVLEKIFAAARRKELQSELKAWQNKLVSNEFNIAELQRSLSAVTQKAQDEYSTSGRKGEFKPTQQMLSTVKQNREGIDRAEKEIAFCKERIADVEAQLAPKVKLRDVA